MADAPAPQQLGESVFVYLIPKAELKSAKQHLQQLASGNALIFIEKPAADDQIELTIVVAGLKASTAAVLEKLQQDGNLIQQVRQAAFDPTAGGGLFQARPARGERRR